MGTQGQARKTNTLRLEYITEGHTYSLKNAVDHENKRRPPLPACTVLSPGESNVPDSAPLVNMQSSTANQSNGGFNAGNYWCFCVVRVAGRAKGPFSYDRFAPALADHSGDCYSFPLRIALGLGILEAVLF